MPISGRDYNNLVLEVYANFSTTRILDVDGDLIRSQNIQFETIYPGGIFSSCTFTVIRDPGRSWLFKQGQRLVVRNGLTIVWEGAIVSPGYQADASSGARTIAAYGFWGAGLLGAVGLRKAWCDMRIGPNAFIQQVGVSADAKCGYSQANSKIKLTPKAEKWNAAEYASLKYTAPTGQKIKRFKYDYDFSEAASASPASVIYFSAAGASYTDETNAYDGSTSTGVTIAAFITTDFLYVGMNQGDTDKLKPGSTVILAVTMGTTKNAVVSTLTAEYWVGNPSGGAWTAITISDGTSAASKTLAQTGNITFTMPGDWGDTALADANKTRKLFIRFKVSVNLTANINLNEITFGQTQDWYMVVFNNTSGSENSTSKISATATGSMDATPATPAQSIEFRIVSNSQQTPWSNGSVYAQFSNVRVYMDSNTITAGEVVADWLASITNLSTDTSQIASNTLVVEPWLTGGNVDFETASSNLARLAQLGDASFNAWAVYLLDSESTATPAGKPVLAYQQQPALSDYDYAVTLGPGTLQNISLAQTPVYNDIIVSYTDANGITQWLTSADDAGLTDATSTAAYGTIQTALGVGQVSSTVAANLGKRFLAANKDVHFYASGSIPVQGYIIAKNNNPVPASEVRAGKRIKILNFLSDEVGVSGGGLTFLISHTAYDDASETVQIDCSVPDNLAVLLARIAAFPNHWSSFQPWQQF
jgi:hypothetical protein